MLAKNTSLPTQGTEQGVGRQTRGCLGVGPAMEGLSPLHFLPEGSGRLLWHRIQRYLRTGTLALWKGVAFGGAGTLLRLRL